MKNTGLSISFIIPTYNYGQYILQAINSVLQQEYNRKLVEIIVVNDGSSDNTYEVLKKLVDEGTIKYHYQTNAGKAAASRKAIELASGDVIFNLDADDYFLPGKIAETVKIFQEYSQVVHVGSPAKICWEDGSRNAEIEPVPTYLLGKPIEGKKLLQLFMQRNMLFGGGSTFAARASLLKKIHWQPDFDMYTDEWLLMATLLQGDSYFLQQPFSVWRVHGSNYSGNTKPEQLAKKQQRLQHSSSAILNELGNDNYPKWLQKNYQLKHDIRSIVWKETQGEKTIPDAINFFWKTILFGGHSLSSLRRYHAFNRLLKW